MASPNKRFAAAESAFFTRLNRLAKPLIKAGVGSPGLVPAGLIVLETLGRNSGRLFEVPVVASAFGDYLLIGTVRGRSQWIKNLATMPTVDYWIKGEVRAARVTVFLPDQEITTKTDALSPWLTPLIHTLARFSRCTGGSFALLQRE
jgi:hypothetical protein